MFYYLDGTVAEILPGLAVIDCGGVGYACMTTNNTLSQLKKGEKKKLYTYLNVGESVFDLYGFASQNELNSFKLLLSVSGVGPKAALAILSANTPEGLAMAIVTEDAKSLTAAQGIGEGAMYRDLIDTTAVDFVVANYLSIACIFLIVAWTFKSIAIPAVLVATIELAIFLNQGLSYFTGASTAFIAPTIISCVQLGATVDYAILMTSRFQEELQSGKSRKEAIRIAADSADSSIVTSALVLFCATLGVSFVSSIDLIGDLCIMLARGALISAFVCLFIMPAVLYVCEPVFNKTTLHWRTPAPKKESRTAKALKSAAGKLPARKEQDTLPENGEAQPETVPEAEKDPERDTADV